MDMGQAEIDFSIAETAEATHNFLLAPKAKNNAGNTCVCVFFYLNLLLDGGHPTSTGRYEIHIPSRTITENPPIWCHTWIILATKTIPSPNGAYMCLSYSGWWFEPL